MCIAIQHGARMTTYGIPAKQISQITGVHLDTARRWKRAGSVPARYKSLVALGTGSDLGALSVAWVGWSLRDGLLTAPEGWKFTPGEVLGIPIRHQEIAALKAERRRAQSLPLPLPALAAHIVTLRLDLFEPYRFGTSLEAATLPRHLQQTPEGVLQLLGIDQPATNGQSRSNTYPQADTATAREQSYGIR